MAKGNVYILIRQDELGELPPLKTRQRYTYQVSDGQGGFTDVVPTWEQLATHNERRFGQMIPVVYPDDGLTYNIIEFETSFIKGELNQLLSIGNPGNFPHGAILSASEARTFRDNQTIETD